MKEDEVSGLADEIAEETYKFFSERFGKIITDMEASVERQQAVISGLTRLESRIKVLEQNFDDHIKNFGSLGDQTERIVAQRFKEMSIRDESHVASMSQEIQQLRESISNLNNEINKLKAKPQEDQKL